MKGYTTLGVLLRAVFLVQKKLAGGERMVMINGEVCDAVGMTLSEYLAANGYDSRTIAVERNDEILPKAQYETTVLEQEDVVEIVRFVGGGK